MLESCADARHSHVKHKKYEWMKRSPSLSWTSPERPPSPQLWHKDSPGADIYPGRDSTWQRNLCFEHVMSISVYTYLVEVVQNKVIHNKVTTHCERCKAYRKHLCLLLLIKITNNSSFFDSLALALSLSLASFSKFLASFYGPVLWK